MRSFRQTKIAEPPKVSAQGPHSDFESLLHEIYASDISKQNSLHPQGRYCLLKESQFEVSTYSVPVEPPHPFLRRMGES